MGLSNHTEPTIISTWITVVLRTFESYGYDKVELLAQSQIDPKSLENPEGRVKIKDYARLWQLAIARTKDPCMGLNVVPFIRPTTFHALGVSLLASATIKDALERLRRFYQIISDEVDVRIHYKPKFTELCFSPFSHRPKPVEASVDAFMAVTISYARLLDDEKLNPARVEFIHSPPLAGANPDRFSKLFRSPVIFDALDNKIVFQTQDIEKKLPTANAEIARQNDQIAVEYLARFQKNHIEHQVRAKLIELLPKGETCLDYIADSIGLSSRTIHRYLNEHRTSYRDILNEVRKHLAGLYLKQPHLSIIEVAFKLGYSDSSNFTRAFKRWFNMSPTEFRKNRRSNDCFE